MAPHLSGVLRSYLQLLGDYDLEKLVTCLECLIEDFSDHIGPYALEMGQYLCRFFSKLSEKDISESQNNKEYEGEAELAAAGCLKAFSQLISTPIDESTLIAL